MNGGPPNARSKTRGHFFSESVHFAKDFPKKVYPIWVALKSPHPHKRFFKKFTPFGTRRKVRTIMRSTFTPRDRYIFPICGFGTIVNVPAQVARAQEGSLLRRLECLSCPCSG